jgi:predicted permease
LFRKEQVDRELDKELRAYQEMAAEEKMKQGMTCKEALRAVRLERGSLDATKEVVRSAGWESFVETLWQDLRFGLRMLRENPGFTAVAVLTLALGSGANTAIFSLIDALMLKSLPVQDPQELVLLQWSAHKMPEFHHSSSYGDCNSRFTNVDPSECTFSRPFYDDLRAHSDMLAGVTAFGGDIELDMVGNGPASIMRGQFVAGNYFDVLGVRPAFGRALEPSDEDPSANAVTVLNYGYWQRAFGGSPSAVGRTVTLSGVPTTIVGVAERRFVSLTPGSVFDAWVPISLRPRLQPHWNPKRDGADSNWMVIIARLRQDVSRKKAETAVGLLFRDEMLHGEMPLSKETDAPQVDLLPAQTGLLGARGTYATPLYILMLAVGIILVISCANVAGMLLARSAARQKEMAVRLALGAGRLRVVRQLLTESVLLSVLGGALGIVVAYWGAHAIVKFVAAGSTRPLGFDATLDMRVLLFTVGISLLAGIIFGLAPAAHGMRVGLTPALKEGTASSAAEGRVRNRWLNADNSLVVAQVALTIVVLVGAGLLVRTLRNLRNIDPGFDTSHILNFGIDLRSAGYKGTQVDTAIDNLQNRLSAIPGVTSASYSSDALLSGSRGVGAFHVIGSPEKASAGSDIMQVGPDFFAVMKIPFREGRDFSPADFAAVSASAEVNSGSASNPAAASSKEPVGLPVPAIVNDEFVRQYLPKTNPLGQRLEHLDNSGQTPSERKDPGFIVVGVVANARYDSLRREVEPTMYEPIAGGNVNFELRTAINPSSIIPAVRSTLNQFDSNLPIFYIRTESETIDQLLFQERLIARLSSFFGVLALVLACVGLYGLLSYEVSRRTREIGIRMALGAPQTKVLRQVIGQGIALAVGGVAVGIISALGLTRYLSSVLYSVHPSDPVTLACVAVILLLVALAACYLPARRATRVDPMVALRYE